MYPHTSKARISTKRTKIREKNKKKLKKNYDKQNQLAKQFQKI